MDIKNLVPSIWRKSDHALRRMEDNPFYALQQETNRAFDDFFNGFNLSPFGEAVTIKGLHVLMCPCNDTSLYFRGSWLK